MTKGPTTQVPQSKPFQPPVRVSGELFLQQKIKGMTMKELKEQVRLAEDERLNEHQRGFYATIPTSLLQLYRDRITELEKIKQGEESLLAKALQCEEYVRQQEASHLAE
eukprot:1431631-Amphidinium_carterae.1